jgi:3-hydroxyisobutyrate dehydrogenase-like beta-hydroxyacid dehydrogenase
MGFPDSSSSLRRRRCLPTQLGKGVRLTTAIIGVGNIGTAVARHLVAGDETVVVAAKDTSHAGALAQQLAPRARAASVEDAITGADAVVIALWLGDFTSTACTANCSTSTKHAQPSTPKEVPA